jgi:hypothetical protein
MPWPRLRRWLRLRREELATVPAVACDCAFLIEKRPSSQQTEPSRNSRRPRHPSRRGAGAAAGLELTQVLGQPCGFQVVVLPLPLPQVDELPRPQPARWLRAANLHEMLCVMV